MLSLFLTVCFIGVFLSGSVNLVFAKTAKDTGAVTVQLKKGDATVTIGVSKITIGKSGKPEVVITSKAISGNIAMTLAEFTPFVACALLDEGTIVDPILLNGGVNGVAGYSMVEPKVLKKSSEKASDEAWEATGSKGKLGFLTYTFDTEKPISAIIVGSYADYAKSDYDSFAKVEVK